MKGFYILFIVIFLVYAFVVSAIPLLAADSNFIAGLEKTRGATGAGYPDATSPANFLAKMLGQALTPIFMGVTGMLSLAYGGYKWMMARGNEQDVELAKTIITNTLIALVIAFSTYAIVRLVFDKVVAPTIGS